MTNVTKFSKRTVLALMILTFLFTSFSTTLTAYAASSKKIANCKFSISSTVAYTGKTLTPTVTVKDGKTTLKKGKHYTVTYSSNKNIGTAKAVIKAKAGSGYTGSKTLTFKIVPAKVTGLKKGTVKTNSIQLKWTKVKGATGYRVYVYNTSTKKYVTAKTVTTNSATMTSLKASTNYTYRVKAYTKVKNSTVWSDYSDKIVVKTLTAHTHKYTSTITKKATCTTAGVMTYKCSCGNSYTKSITKTGHNYKPSVTKAATCTATGVKTYKCSACNASYTETIAKVNHNWKSTTVHHDAVYGTRDITENWVHYAHFRHLYLNDKAVAMGFDNQAEMRNDELYYYKFGDKQYAPTHTVKIAEVMIKEDEYNQWTSTGIPTSSLQWIYRYDPSSTNIATMAGDAMDDFNFMCRNTYGWFGVSSYSDTAVKKIEIKVVGTEKYVITNAYDETITTCTACGAHK